MPVDTKTTHFSISIDFHKLMSSDSNEEYPDNLPDHLTRDEELAEAEDFEYISKSRITQWKKCPRKFYYKYVLGLREESTQALERGSDIHEIFEEYYENAREYVDSYGEIPENLLELLPSEDKYMQYMEPYIANFLDRERERADYAETAEIWKPIAVETYAENHGLNENTHLMGYADVILHAGSLNEVDEDDGVVIVDFKTGKTPDKKYLNEGIYLEGEFYAMLFKEKYDINGIGGYYPKENDYLITQREAKRQEDIENAVEIIIDSGMSVEDYDAVEQPLCAWGEGEEERCPYYEMCESTWAAPIDNKEKFEDLNELGVSDWRIADILDTSVNAVQYWQRKLELND